VRETLVCTLVFFVLASSLIAQQNSAAKPKPLVFTHVTVIDVTGGRSQPDRTVMIVGAHITEIGESAKIMVPKDFQISGLEANQISHHHFPIVSGDNGKLTRR
jgi:hypothetical protein